MTTYATEHKVPEYVIRVMRNTDPDFYPVVGPFLAKREVVGDLGSPVWDDAGKTWHVAVSDGEAVGMVAYWRRTVCSFWVAPRTRGLAIGYALLRHLMRDIPENTAVSTVATEESVALFESVGFKRIRERGRYHICQYGPDIPAPPNQPGPLRGV